MKTSLCIAAAMLLAPVLARAQASAAGAPQAGRSAAPRIAMSVTSPSFPDGAIIPMRHGARGDNKSPAFEFHWWANDTPTNPPETLQSYAVVFHDIENPGPNRSTVDSLHWSAFNIPGTTKVLPEGLPAGDLPDGTKNGPGGARRNGGPGAYSGPASGPGPYHHYVFEFYALDTKLDLPGDTTRDTLMKAMEGHVIGKAAYTGRTPER